MSKFTGIGVIRGYWDRSVSSGVRGLMVRIARRVNRVLRRRGRFWADRWHGRDLEGPRQVRNALVYVLQNRRKHAGSAALDPLSSASSFDGFANALPATFRSVGLRTEWLAYATPDRVCRRARGPPPERATQHVPP